MVKPMIKVLRSLDNKTVVWPAAFPISDLFGEGELILGESYPITGTL